MFCFVSCSKPFDYQSALKEELESGEKNNDIILDIHFGMSNDDFYNYCRQLNQEQKATQGPKNRSVQVSLPDFERPAHMLFYPNFKDNMIVEMPILFAYDDWAPWNKETFANKFILNIRDLVSDWYDVSLKLVKDANGYPGYIAIQGNRQLALTVQDDQYVKLIVSNMSEIQVEGELTFKRN